MESQRLSGFACHGDVVRVLTTDDLSKRLESPTGFDRPNPTRTVPLKQRLQLVAEVRHDPPLMSDKLDSIFDLVAAATEDGKTESGAKALHKYPGEKPTKFEKKTWVDDWTDYLNGNGFSSYLRKEEPFELKKFAPRNLITVPDDTSGGTDNALLSRIANIESKNADIAHTNSINKAEKEARVLEIQTRLYSKLSASMRDTAPLRLEQLKTKYPAKDESGTAIAGAYLGVEMFLELSDEVTSEAVRSKDQKKYENEAALTCSVGGGGVGRRSG